MAGTQSLGGLRRNPRNGLGTVAHDETRPAKKAKVASEAQQTYNGEDLNHGVPKPMPRSLMATGSGPVLSGAPQKPLCAEDLNAIGHAESPTENERCEEQELVISREATPIESAETREGEAKHGAEEEASNTTGKPEGHEMNIKTGNRMDKPTQKKQGNTKPTPRKSKETSKIDEAIELEVLAEYAMICSLAKDPDPQIQQCYAYKLMGETDFDFHDASHLFPFVSWEYVKARYFELRGHPYVSFFKKATQQCTVEVEGIGSQIEGQTSRIVRHMDAWFSKLESLMQDAIASANGLLSLSELKKARKSIEAQEEDIRHLREAWCNLNRRITEWWDKYWEAVQELLDAKAVGMFSREVSDRHGSPSPEHKDACPWCFLKRRRYPVPPWEMDRLPPPTKEQLDRLLHRTSDGLGCYRWVFLLIFVFLLVWLLWTTITVCLDWYDATKGIIPFVDLMDQIAENAGLAFSLLQLPLYTFIPLQISGGLDPLNGVQSSQFAIVDVHQPVHDTIHWCQQSSQKNEPEDEKTRNITGAWVNLYWDGRLYYPEETEPQAALRLTKTYMASIEDAFMTLSDRHPDRVTIAALSKNSRFLLDTVVPTRVDQLRETIHNFIHSSRAFMEEMNQAIKPLEACGEFFDLGDGIITMTGLEAKRLAFHAKHIVDLYKLSLSKAELAISAAENLSRELKRKYVFRLEGDVSEVAVGLSRVQNKLQHMIRTRDRALKWYRREVKRRNTKPDLYVSPSVNPFMTWLSLDDNERPAWVWKRWWCRYSWAKCGLMSYEYEFRRQHEY
ncbi:hypothetical protein FBULB1_2174 [Fusarium bulbicola]|nr:hypothetical protein FBULB1_2174 [Fusarium bulbicola]